MPADNDATGGADATRSRFQFDLRAIMAVTATVAVVLASVGREHVFELSYASCLLTVVCGSIYLLERRRSAAAPTDVGQHHTWVLLGALAGYIVILSTESYSELRHRVVWVLACGIAAAYGSGCSFFSMSDGILRRAILGGLFAVALIGSAFSFYVPSGSEGGWVTAVAVWEVLSAALAGAAIVLVVDTLRRLEAHWQLPGYVVPCIWLIVAAAFAEFGSRFVPGW